LIQEKSFSVLKKAQEGVTDIHSRLEAMQSYALSYILEQNVKFSFNFSSAKSGSMRFKLSLDNSKQKTDICGSRGGGVEDIMSFLFRVICVLTRKQRKFIALDEPFTAISQNKFERLMEFIAMIVKKTGLQLLIVTHKKQLLDIADVKYKVNLIDGSTKIKRLKNG